MNVFKRIFEVLDPKEKLHFFYIFVLILLMTALETFSVGLVLPTIKFLVSDNFASQVINFFKSSFSIDVNQQDVSTYGLLFILIFFIFKFFFVAITIYRQLIYLFNILVNKCSYLYAGYIFMDYEKYTRTNSSILVRNVSLLVDRFNATSQSCFIILTDCTLFLSIFILLLYFDWKSTLAISSIFTLISLIYYFGTKRKFIDWGTQSAKYEGLKFKFLYEGLSSMKDIKISNKLDFFLKNYSKNVSAHGMLTVKKTFLKALPKQTFEILAVLALVVLGLVFVSSSKSLDEFLPLAGVFAVSAFKILPAGNRILFAFQNLMFDLTSIKILHEEIHKNKPNEKYLDHNKDDNTLKFDHEIKISNVSFSYQNNNRKILEDISLNIKKDSTVGIIGKSGSGKSTLMDIMIGLLNPTSGTVYCDSVNVQNDIFSWYDKIGYVPQSIYLMDDTILKNIAFGINEEDIDIIRVKECIKLSRLDDVVFNNELGLNTVVGEKGIRLSGGQIQRIGIARALYKKPEILFFDESTSSLDMKTEDEIMNSVNELLTGITKIIITHRITTLKECDIIYHIENLKILNSGKYDQMSKIKYN